MSSAQIPADKPADPYKAKNLDTDASVEHKVNDLMKFAQDTKFGLMTTVQSSSGMLVSRCMAIAGVENGIDLIFHTNTETGKAEEIEKEPHVNIGFVNSGGEWASFSGIAQITNDEETVKKHYSSSLKAWVGDLGDGKHDGSPSDPRLAVIRVKTNTATYAITKVTAMGKGYEIAKGMVTGNAPDVTKLRELTQEEVASWRQSKALISN